MVKRLKGISDYVGSLSDDTEMLTDAELQAKTEEFRKRHADGESLDELLPEAFAVAREAAWRVLDQRPFDVQVMGAAALHFGNVAEMKTGEGKTLTSVLPAYLNGIGGNGVHIVTVTDDPSHELGFDYLRDNMAHSLDDCVQRGHNFAIVDEVDSILIDEARTPL